MGEAPGPVDAIAAARAHGVQRPEVLAQSRHGQAEQGGGRAVRERDVVRQHEPGATGQRHGIGQQPVAAQSVEGPAEVAAAQPPLAQACVGGLGDRERPAGQPRGQQDSRHPARVARSDSMVPRPRPQPRGERGWRTDLSARCSVDPATLSSPIRVRVGRGGAGSGQGR